MKKIILLLVTLLSFVMATEIKSIEEVLLYKTTKSKETITDIKTKQKLFKKIAKSEDFSEKGISYWLQIKLSDEMKSGDYMVRYVGLDFDVSTFTSEQDMKKLKIGGVSKKLTFEYKRGRDSKVYYFHLVPTYLDSMHSISIQTIEEFYTDTQNYFYYLTICGFILGLILMAGFYNAFMYYYNREKAFIYYAFMQLFMVLVLVFYTGLVMDSGYTMTMYNFFSLMVALFATLFTREFFKTSLHVPQLDMLLRFYLFLLAFDMLYLIFTGKSIVSMLRLYSIFGFVYIVIGFYRWRQGFTPANFFLIGWGALILSLFVVEYGEEDFWISPLLLGSPIEAILLAIALAYKIKLIQNEKEQQKELMVHQSKLASMGEMIGNIAHQWRQPLTHLSYTVMNIQDAFKHNSLDESYLDKKVNEANGQIEFMSQTIDDFRDFYAVSKIKEKFSLKIETEHVLALMKHSLEEMDIVIEFVVVEDLEITNYKNEYKQVLLNFLSNAKDALIKNVTLSPKITISINKNEVTIVDNAGGIQEKNLNKIFEPYFTTKENHSGIGLYMSKMIVERNMGGKLSVRNVENGAEFKMIF